MRTAALAGGALAVLAACAGAPKVDHYAELEAARQAALKKAETAPVYPGVAAAAVPCAPAACPAMMRRAQAWIAANGDYRIQVASDTLVQTFGPLRDPIGEAYTVTVGAGQVRIEGSIAPTAHCRAGYGQACFDPAAGVQRLVAALQAP